MEKSGSQKIALFHGCYVFRDGRDRAEVATSVKGYSDRYSVNGDHYYADGEPVPNLFPHPAIREMVDTQVVNDYEMPGKKSVKRGYQV